MEPISTLLLLYTANDVQSPQSIHYPEIQSPISEGSKYDKNLQYMTYSEI